MSKLILNYLAVPAILTGFGDAAFAVSNHRTPAQWKLLDPGTEAGIHWPTNLESVPRDSIAVWRESALAELHQEHEGVDASADFRILASSDESLNLYAGASEREGWPRRQWILHSVDAGNSWEIIMSKETHVYQYPVQFEAVVLDPQDSTVIAGATDGLYRRDIRKKKTERINWAPPGAVSVSALAVHPEESNVLFMATRVQRWNGSKESDAGFYRGRGSLEGLRYFSGENASWEDFSFGIPGEVTEIGFGKSDASLLYVRTADSQVYEVILPDTLKHEDFGWERISTPPGNVRFRRQPPLRVHNDYARRLVGEVGLWDTQGWIGGYSVAPGSHVIYASYGHEKTGYVWGYVRRSRDGGVTWQNVESIGYELHSAGGVPRLLVDGRGKFLALRGIPNVATFSVRDWTSHPVDPLTLYVAQTGRGLLYRSYDIDDGSSWEEISQGLDPLLWITGVFVDSLSTVYLETGQGIFRKRDTQRPYFLHCESSNPDTLLAGEPANLRIRPVGLDSGERPFDGSLSAEQGSDRYPLSDEGTGVYSASVPTRSSLPGFDQILVILESPGRPRDRASVSIEVMIVPENPLVIYDGGLSDDWLASGDVRDFNGDGPVHLIEGSALYIYTGAPVNPFGYRLELRAFSETDQELGEISINGQSVSELRAEISPGSWKQISIPAELLNPLPEEREENGDYYSDPAFIDTIRISSSEPLLVDDLRLVPIRKSSGRTATEVAMTEGPPIPAGTSLGQNFPNPFNAQTRISFRLARSSRVELIVYDLLGQRVRTLVDEWLEAGPHRVAWDGRDGAGRSVATGVYMYELRSGSESHAARMVLLR